MDLDASLPPWEKIFIRRGTNVSRYEIGSYVWYEDDLTLTFDDNDNICWKKVKGKIKHNWASELIIFTTESGKEVCVTNNHSIFAVKKNSSEKPQLIDAKDLKIDDLVVCYGSDLNSKKINLEKITKTLRQIYTGNVYDISVEDTERFFAGTGIGVHNSSLYPSNGGF